MSDSATPSQRSRLTRLFKSLLSVFGTRPSSFDPAALDVLETRLNEVRDLAMVLHNTAIVDCLLYIRGSPANFAAFSAFIAGSMGMPPADTPWVTTSLQDYALKSIKFAYDEVKEIKDNPIIQHELYVRRAHQEQHSALLPEIRALERHISQDKATTQADKNLALHILRGEVVAELEVRARIAWLENEVRFGRGQNVADQDRV